MGVGDLLAAAVTEKRIGLSRWVGASLMEIACPRVSMAWPYGCAIRVSEPRVRCARTWCAPRTGTLIERVEVVSGAIGGPAADDSRVGLVERRPEVATVPAT